MKKRSLAIKSLVFLVNLLVAVALVYLLLAGILMIEVFLALIFIQGFTATLLLSRYYFYKKVKSLAKSMGFEMITGFMEQPRLEGHYKGRWFQIHYVNKESGDDPGVLRTYIKLQYKEFRSFDDKKLEKYRGIHYKDNRIITIKHIVRPYKNYLLMKRSWFTFDKTRINDLMDFLIKISKETELKNQ